MIENRSNIILAICGHRKGKRPETEAYARVFFRSFLDRSPSDFQDFIYEEVGRSIDSAEQTLIERAVMLTV